MRGEAKTEKKRRRRERKKGETTSKTLSACTATLLKCPVSLRIHHEYCGSDSPPHTPQISIITGGRRGVSSDYEALLTNKIES